MSVKKISPNQISEIIVNNIKNPDIVFVFSTDISASTWAEWTVINSEKTGVKTVSLNRFIAWDDFKRQFVSANVQGKQAIPSLLRKIFVYDLIFQNSQQAALGKPLLKSLINPLYAQKGYSFADWLSRIIPSLKLLHDRTQEIVKLNPDFCDQEDLDYEFIYQKYKDFLGDEFFEPSWLKPDFSAIEKEFFVFYPEQFTDFLDFCPLLEGLPSVTLFENTISLKSPVVYKYPNARKELRHSLLYIRDKVNSSGGTISYEDFAYTVAGLEEILPYVEREFNRYCIPYVIRTGKSYTRNSAGSIFENLQQCKKNNFSYESVRALLLNTYIPWKDKALNESLIRKGCDYHCICNYEKGRESDIWILALKQSKENEKELALYQKLRKSVECICDASDFASIKKAWILFKQDFLIDDDFSLAANNILSSCIVLLDELISIEKDFISQRNLNVISPFDFFLNELRNKKYTPQQNQSGVNIFDYKVAASAAFKYNIVINCTQNALTVSNSLFSFLTSQKREALGIKDSDYASNVYIDLYNKFENTIFTCSEEAFDGFSIPHNYFKVEKKSPFEKLEDSDFIRAEKKWFLEESLVPDEISDNQKMQFNKWKESSDFSKTLKKSSENKELSRLIDYKINTERSRNGGQFPKITQSDLNDFFPCSRNWIFKKVLQLKEDSLETSLLDNFTKGNICHKTLEILFDEIKKLSGFLPTYWYNEFDMEIEPLVDRSVEMAIHSREFDYYKSPLSLQVLESQKEDFKKIIIAFLKRFCADEENKGYGGCRILSVEEWLEYKDLSTLFGISGKIDCILKEPDGKIIIVDYKSSSLPSAKACWLDINTMTLGNFQCATYVYLYDYNNLLSDDKMKMIFTAIEPSSKNKETTAIDDDNEQKTLENFWPTITLLKEYTECFEKKITEGRLVPDSSSDCRLDRVNVLTNCKNCSFNSICRTTYSLAGHKI